MFSHHIAGWSVSGSRKMELSPLPAMNMAAFLSDDLSELVYYSDHGSNYVAIRFTDRIAELDAKPSVGSVGDSYDNALAEAVNGLYKTELIRRKGPWRTIEHVEPRSM